MTVAPGRDPVQPKVAQDGRHQDGWGRVAEEILLDRELPEGAITLWILLADIGLKLGQGLLLEEVTAKLPCGRASIFTDMRALNRRQLVSWRIKGGKYFFTLTAPERVYGGLSNHFAKAHHAVVCDGDIPLRAKLALFTLNLYDGDKGLFVAEKTLAARLGWDLRTVQKWLDWLEESGYQTTAHRQRRRNGKWTPLRRNITPMTDLYSWPDVDQEGSRSPASPENEVRRPTKGVQHPSPKNEVRRHPASPENEVQQGAPSPKNEVLTEPENLKSPREPRHPPGGGVMGVHSGDVAGATTQSNPGAPEAQESFGGSSGTSSPTSSQRPAPPSPTQEPPKAKRTSRAPKASQESSPSGQARELASKFGQLVDDSRALRSQGFASSDIDYHALALGIDKLLQDGVEPMLPELLEAAMVKFCKRPNMGGANSVTGIFLKNARRYARLVRERDPHYYWKTRDQDYSIQAYLDRKDREAPKTVDDYLPPRQPGRRPDPEVFWRTSEQDRYNRDAWRWP
jgi:hypothetical protein